jgi:hypothetical protein
MSRHRHNPPSYVKRRKAVTSIAKLVIDDSIPALVEMSGGPVEASRAALASLFGSIDWNAIGLDTVREVFLLVVKALDTARDERALVKLGGALTAAWRSYRADYTERTLAEELRVFLKTEASDRTVGDVIAMCRKGHVRRAGGAS